MRVALLTALLVTRLVATRRPCDDVSLRHSWASSALVAGLPLEWVSRMLGHADTSITSRVYGRWLPHPRPAALDTL